MRRVAGEEPLELDDMLPVVAEVVDVEEAEAFAAVEIERRTSLSSTEPFSWAIPALLRVGSIRQCWQKAL
jgi:signal transduction protein with GAF and PtsI domain